MTQLTDNGRVWAEKHARTSTIANVALYGDTWPAPWPAPFVESSRVVANEMGEAQAAVNAALAARCAAHHAVDAVAEARA